MRTLVFTFLAWLALAAGPAAAQIGAPTQIGSGVGATGSSQNLVVTFTGAASAGDLVVVLCGGTNSGSITTPGSLSDTKGNPYVQGVAYLGGTNALRAAYSVLGTAVAAGDTITIPFSSGTARKLCTVLRVTGMQPPTGAVLDHSGAGATGTGTAPGFTTTTFAQASTLVLASTLMSGSSASSETWTEGAGFTSLPPVTSSDGRILRTAYSIRSAMTAVTYAPTNSGSQNWSSKYEAFRGFVAAPVSTCGNRSLMGVGC